MQNKNDEALTDDLEKQPPQTLTRRQATLDILKLAIPFSSSRWFTIVGNFIGILMIVQNNPKILPASNLIVATQSFINTTAVILYSSAILMGKEKKAGNPFEVGKLFHNSLLLSAGVSIPTIIAALTSKHILNGLGQASDNTLVVQNYFNSYAFGIPALMGLTCLQQFGLGIADKKLVLIPIAGNRLLTAALSYILIFGKLGAPNLGVQGLAYANAISAWLTLIPTLMFILKLNKYRAYQVWQRPNFDLSVLKDLCKKGIPIAIQQGSEVFVITATAVMAGWLGPSALSAHQITTQYHFLALIGLYSTAQAIGVAVSGAQGEKRFINIPRLGNMGIAVSLSVAALSSVVFCTAPKQLASLFIDVNNENNADTISLTTTLFYLQSAGLMLDAVRNGSAGGLRGLSQNAVAMITGILSLMVLGLPLGYTLGFAANLGWGLKGIYLARDIGLALGGSYLFYRWNRQSTSVAQTGELASSNTWSNLYQRAQTFFGKRSLSINALSEGETEPLIRDYSMKYK